MAYNVSQDFTNKLYSGESNFRAILTIGENTIDNDQIASISISSPIIDDSKQVFYVGSFISQKITIKFKNMDKIDVHSGDNVDLSIGQYVNNEWVDVPIGKFLVDDLAEDYFEKCEISCLDYAVKFKPNIDYSLCFTDGKATIKEILEYICDYFNVEIGDYPTINDDVEIGTYDSTVSGKQWISYIAELKGCNAKIDRLGRLTLQPLKQSSNVPINALESASFELGEEFNITKVTFFDAIRNYTYGDDEGNTLFIRQDNPFITDTKVVQNIYDNLCAIKYSASGKEFDIEDADAHPINVNTIYGETSQETYTGKNLVYTTGKTSNGITATYDKNTGITTISGTASTYTYAVFGENQLVLPAGTYTISVQSPAQTNIGVATFNENGVRTPRPIQKNQTSYTFTLTEPSTKYDVYITALTVGTSYNFSFKLQMEQGSTATSFEKYVGGIPSPNPDFPQDVNTVKGSNNLKIVGKNLSKVSEGNNIVITDTLQAGTYTFSIEFTNSIGYALKANDGSGATIVSRTPNDSGRDVASFTLTTPTKIFLNGWTRTTGKTFAESVSEYQLEEGTEATEYEPYQSKEYELDLGKNLFDKDNANIVNGYLDTAGMVLISSQLNRILYIPCKPNTTYTISRSIITSTFRVATYDSTPMPSVSSTASTYSVSGLIKNNSATSITITTGTNAKYLLVHYGRLETDPSIEESLATIQIEKGSIATDYTPYHEPIELNKIGTYQDYITKNTGKNLFDTSIQSGTYGSATYNVASDGLITQSASDGSAWDISQRRIFYLPAGTYTITIDVKSGAKGYMQLRNLTDDTDLVSTSGNSKTFTIDSRKAVGFKTYGSGGTYPVSYYLQIEKGETSTEYEPYGKDEWYKYGKIGKYTFTGNENFTWDSDKQRIIIPKSSIGVDTPSLTTTQIFNVYNQKVIGTTFDNLYNKIVDNCIGLSTNNSISIRSTMFDSLNTGKNYIANTDLYYILATPTYEKITYQPLIDQLNALQNAGLFEGVNHITVDTLNEVPTVDIDYYKKSHFNIWSLKTHNFGDFTLDAWDNIDYDLDGKHYLTLNNNTITYEMSIMSDVDTKIPNKQQTATTNIIGGDDKTNIKKIKTTVDQLNASVDILSQQQTNTQTDVSQLQIDVNGINTTVERIENVEIGKDDTVGLRHRLSQTEQKVDTITNMFQITGGINIIRNSAFLLQDELWEFTDNGTNPYHTDLGNSYNSTLSGITVSVAEIKARSMKIKSKSENITNLKTDGTKYTFNFYHKQDTNMTTTIKMYSTENNNIKAFNDIVITGQQPLKNYEVSFVPTYANYTLEIIVASATSIGYAYLYDMMLNAGDKQSWQPASDEIYSTTLQMSRLGLQVYSVGDGTITLLGSDGLTSWETSDGKTKGRLVSKRTIDGDRVKTITTQSVKLVSDATKTDEELTHEDKWVETTTKVSGKIAKVIYMESGV